VLDRRLRVIAASPEVEVNVAMAFGPPAASLGLAYATKTSLPDRFQGGMFVGQHGSWNRQPRSGYKVIFVPFRNGRPSGNPIDVLTGSR
jgi:hypothetical protein